MERGTLNYIENCPFLIAICLSTAATAGKFGDGMSGINIASFESRRYMAEKRLSKWE